jgi:hypothetical protein
MEKVLVHVSDVSHVKSLSKDYMVQLICTLIGFNVITPSVKRIFSLLPRASVIYILSYQEQIHPSRTYVKTVTLSQQISFQEKLTQRMRLFGPDRHFPILMNVISSSTFRIEYAACCQPEARYTLVLSSLSIYKLH